jgi:hypothetical protein
MLFIECSSRLTSRRAIAPDDDCCQGDQGHRARLKGVKKPPHRAVRRRVPCESRGATLEQDRRRRATNQVIQHSAANMIAVRSIGLSVHNPSGNAHPERQPGRPDVCAVLPGGTRRPVAAERRLVACRGSSNTIGDFNHQCNIVHCFGRVSRGIAESPGLMQSQKLAARTVGTPLCYDLDTTRKSKHGGVQDGSYHIYGYTAGA